ncbi:S-layer homology domain-containing protein [Gorillibacterium massiliense]|uniref:S-layer homology domain-containing protein n=1 Tax=Gorillibacterium massiliense TaxID=1280390 RepID=UPI0004B48446|nr:S-layer homology domain-containing protein [Gorillibacterium massiliense]
MKSKKTIFKWRSAKTLCLLLTAVLMLQIVFVNKPAPVLASETISDLAGGGSGASGTTPDLVYAWGFEQNIAIKEGVATAKRVETAPVGGYAFEISAISGSSLGLDIKSGWPTDVSKYGYLMFDMMADNADLLKNISELYPRLYTKTNDGSFLQLNGNSEAGKIQGASANNWVTVVVPLTSIHEGGNNHDLSQLTGIRLRFINGTADVSGMMYIRDVRFSNDPNSPSPVYEPTVDARVWKDFFNGGGMENATVDGEAVTKIKWHDDFGTNKYLYFNDLNQDLSAYANKFFVFDMKVTDKSFLEQIKNDRNGDFVVMSLTAGSTPNDFDDGARLLVSTSEIKTKSVGEWITVSTQIAWNNAHNYDYRYSPADLKDAKRLRMNLTFDKAPTGDVYIKNPRFQDNPYSPIPGPGATVDAPTAIAKSANSITVSSAAPGNGQNVQYAKSETNTAPANGWQDSGTFDGLKQDTDYYFFARAKQKAGYNTGAASTGTLIRTDAKTVTPAEEVAEAVSDLTWDKIKGANIDKDNVKTNLNLPVKGLYDTDISWITDHSAITNTGVVTRSGDTDATVKLTATVSKGGETSTVEFDLTVIHFDATGLNVTKALTPVYPTKDYVISNFVVTDYGAKAERGFDNREAFQAAIDAAYNAGGGVVYIPAGHYEFRSTATGTKSVKTKTGTTTESYERVLDVKRGVQLRGDWADPEKNDGKVLGTILEVYAGKNSPNYDRYVDSEWIDPQAGNAVRTTKDSVADRFIDMDACTGVTNLSIWYPEQVINNGEAVKYPWTLFHRGGDSATVENVTLVNSYNGFYSAPSELHYVMNSYITALSTGIEIHVCTDIGRIENVKIDPKYWANSGLAGAPSLAEVTAYTREHGTGFQMHRSDWEYVSDLYISGYNKGMWVGREYGFADSPNAQFYRLHIENSGTALDVEDVNSYGLLISDSVFAASGDGTRAAYFHSDFNKSVQFNSVDFKGPIVSDGKDGVISFENCTFDDYGDYALKLNSGNVLLTQSQFMKSAGHAYLGANVNTFKSLNSGFGDTISTRSLKVTDESNGAAKVQIDNGTKYQFEPMPKNISTDIAKQPKAGSEWVVRFTTDGAIKGNVLGSTTDPTVDVSADLQTVLNYMKETYGGGTVYLSSGKYLIDHPIVVPSGVELRGSWDVQHHTLGGGTAIFTTYEGTGDGNGASLIQLEANAGLRGLNIVQKNLVIKGSGAGMEVRKTPFLIQGKGRDVYIIDVTVPLGDKGIDLASYDTSGHYVEYFAGSLARAGVWVGGGAEGGYIRNMQFNPHYGVRSEGLMGYPAAQLDAFQRSNYSALKFGDVKNETIFNNFVFGSKNGIHFLKDEITGKNPEEIVVIGHGTDGSTFGLFVEDASPSTKITLINSELVTTQNSDNPQPNRSYVLMGDSVNTAKVDPKAVLTLYNSAFWGNVSEGVVVNNGNVRLQQTNFSNPGDPSIRVKGGSAYVYTSYFQTNNVTNHAYLNDTGKGVELSNNYYARTGGLNYVDELGGYVYGSDIKTPMILRLLSGTGPDKKLALIAVARDTVMSGTLKMTSPAEYAADFTPVRFNSLKFGENISLDLPYYGSSAPFVFEVTLDSGEKIELSTRVDASFADRYDGKTGLEYGSTPFAIANSERQIGQGKEEWNGPDDLSMTGNFKWDEKNLYLYLVVKDDIHYLVGGSGDIWQGDGIQVAVNTDKSASDGGQTYTSELGFALDNDKATVHTWCWAAPTGRTTGAFKPDGLVSKIKRDDTAKTTTYDLAIPWSSLTSQDRPANFDRMGMTILVNDSDGSKTARLAMEYGIGLNIKNYPKVADLYLLKEPYANLVIEAAKAAVAKAQQTKKTYDIDMALNSIALIKDDAVKTNLSNALLGTGHVTPPNGGGGGATSTPTPDGSTEATVKGTTDASGKTTGSVSEKVMDDLVEAAKKSGADMVTIKLESTAQTVSANLTVPAAALSNIAKNTNTKLRIVTGVATVTFDAAAIDSISRAAGLNDVNLSITKVDASTLSAEAQMKVGNRPVYDFTVTAGGSAISSFNGGSASISIPYTLGADEDPNAVVAYYLDSTGKVQTVRSFYNSGTKSLDFTVSHFSKYAVGYNKISFNDVKSSAWYYAPITFIAARGITADIAAGSFNPNAEVTRGEFIVMLMRAYGIQPDSSFGSNFADAGNTYYTNYLAKAKELGIAAGVGNNKFAPEGKITRQDMFTLLYHALDKLGELPKAKNSNTLSSFHDGASVSDYARNAMLALVQGGIVSGEDGGKLSPQGKSTRAQVAAVLYNLLSR